MNNVIHVNAHQIYVLFQFQVVRAIVFIFIMKCINGIASF